MTYFIPSFLQKRILRYALSRLELLDTDALDLEKLDIAWGRRSTVELRDIPVHARVGNKLEERALCVQKTDCVCSETVFITSTSSKRRCYLSSDPFLATDDTLGPIPEWYIS